MRDEKNVEDAQKEGNALFLVMSYGSEQAIPREVLIQREIQKITGNTQKYIRYLELTSRPRSADIAFTIPRRRW